MPRHRDFPKVRIRGTAQILRVKPPPHRQNALAAEFALASSQPLNRPDTRTRDSTSRNIQATGAEAGFILALLSKGQKACPTCPYRQKKGRMPDLRRHVRSHFRKNSDNVCRRVLNKAGMWTGGCGNSFSRKDALKRHLKKGCCKKE